MRLIHARPGLLPGLLVLLALAVRAAAAGQEDADPGQAARREFEAARLGMEAARQKGPLDIPLLQQATLRLPTGYAFVPNPAAARFVAAMGNPVDDSFLGLVLPGEEGEDWIATVSFEKSGYVKDDDAKSWNVDDMLKSLREGAEEINHARADRGIPELELLGWAEPPAYDAASHRLVWALAVANKGAPPGQPQSVNYNTHALGREGYVSLNLVASRDELERRKPVAQTLLAALEFNQGKRYEDFDADTDHAAEFGLAALVGGAMVAKKFGLFALAGLFVAKFGKLAAIAAAALFGVFGRRRGGKKGDGGGSLDA
jgi:uncharacterized membrane-anchored protein